MESEKKIIIAAGGTGGHLYPGIALAQELKKRGFAPIFILKKDDVGRDILLREKINFFEIPICGLPRTISLRFIKFFFLLIKGIFASYKILRETKPEVVIGMGGYISFPAVVLSRIMCIPSIIHEQNFIPGLSNKLLFPFVNKVAISFEDSIKYFPKNKTVVTGNPLRRDLIKTKIEDAYNFFGISKEKFTILVFGGSQGASKINKTVLDSLPMLEEVNEKVQFIHLAGVRDFHIVSDGYKRNNIAGKVFQYLYEMGQAYAAADLVICRAGATTIAELSILNKNAILIPFPFATANHQYFNASALVKRGKGTIMLEKELSPDFLAKIIISNINSFKKHNFDVKLPELFPQEILAELIEKYF